MLRDRYDHMWDEGTVRPCAVTLQPTYLPEHMSSLNCNGSRASCNLGGDGEMAGHEGALALHHYSPWSRRKREVKSFFSVFLFSSAQYNYTVSCFAHPADPPASAGGAITHARSCDPRPPGTASDVDAPIGLGSSQNPPSFPVSPCAESGASGGRTPGRANCTARLLNAVGCDAQLGSGSDASSGPGA